MLVRALPGVIVGRTKFLQVNPGARKGEHRHWLTDPDAMLAQVLLEGAYLATFVVFRQNQVGLDPRNPLSRINEKLTDPFSRNATIFVQFVASGIGDRLNAAFHGNAMRVTK